MTCEETGRSLPIGRRHSCSDTATMLCGGGIGTCRKKAIRLAHSMARGSAARRIRWSSWTQMKSSGLSSGISFSANWRSRTDKNVAYCLPIVTILVKARSRRPLLATLRTTSRSEPTRPDTCIVRRRERARYRWRHRMLLSATSDRPHFANLHAPEVQQGEAVAMTGGVANQIAKLRKRQVGGVEFFDTD